MSIKQVESAIEKWCKENGPNGLLRLAEKTKMSYVTAWRIKIGDDSKFTHCESMADILGLPIDAFRGRRSRKKKGNRK